MESLEERSSGSNAERSPEPRDGKIHRIAAHTQGLLADLRTWIDLRLDLAILRVEEQIDELRNELALGITLALFGLFAALFSLATIAIGVGWLLGHPFWGFLAVSVALILVVAALRIVQPALVPPSNLFEAVRGERDEEAADEARPAPSTSTGGGQKDTSEEASPSSMA